MQTINNTTISNSTIPYIQIYNGGGYVAKVDVYYKYNGFSLHQSTPQMSVGMVRKLFIPDQATNLDIYFKIADCGWVVIGIEKFDKMSTMCFSMWGAIFNPRYAKVDCDSALMKYQIGTVNVWKPMLGMSTMPCNKNCNCGNNNS